MTFKIQGWLFLFVAVVAGAAEPAVPVAEDEDDEIIETIGPARPDPAADNFWAAVRELQSGKSHGTSEARAALQAAADAEFTAAQVLLGDCLVSGSFGFKKDAKRGANLYLLAAERGNAYAMVNLGHCYAAGTGVRRNYDKARQWLTAALAPASDYTRPSPPANFTDAAAGGSVDGIAGQLATDPAIASQAKAHYLLGLIESQAKNLAAAHVHFIAAAEAGPNGRYGIYEAAVQGALNFAFGYGVDRNASRARQLLEHSRTIRARLAAQLVQTYVALNLVDEFAAADVEESLADAGQYQTQLQFGIAQQLAKKGSKDYNPAEALLWYELAADNGQVWATMALAFAYTDGSLGPVDRAKAFRYFEAAGGGDRPKHYLATANLAICYLHGLGVPANADKANDIFRRYRDKSFLCYLGSIGQAPGEIQTYDQMKALLESWAKNRRDASAQYFMGRRELEGWEGEADVDAALDWFKKSAKAKHPAALTTLGELYATLPYTYTGLRSEERAQQTALDCFVQAAELGHADALANVAGHHSTGRATPQDFGKALIYLERCLAVDPAHARAHNNLASLHEHFLLEGRMGRGGDAHAMLRHYEKAAELKFPLAAANLGRIYFEGKLVSQDYQKAYRYFDEAAEQGMADAHHRLGLMHELGLGIPITYTEAAYHYRLAALGGNADALRRLIDFYLSGRGVSIDFNRAYFWLYRMVQMGHQRALMPIADIMLAKQEHAAAVRLLRDMAKAGDAYIAGFAHERLSRCYANGWGVKKNEARSKRHFTQAVAKGDGDALTTLALSQFEQGQLADGVATMERAALRSTNANYFLGQMYFFGTNVAENKDTGLKYMRAAAARNHVKALYFLAASTANGQPGAPSLEEALRLAEQAEAAGHPEAAALRARLETKRGGSIETERTAQRPTQSL